MKVAYNKCYGGFSLSDKAVSMLNEMNGLEGEDKLEPHSYGYPHNSKGHYRHDPDLIRVIEQLGEQANGRCAKLVITEIDGVRYIVKEYDGMETVLEPKDIPWITAL